MSQPPGRQLKVVTRRHPSPRTPQPACLHTAQPPSAHIFPSPNLYLCISFPCNTSRNCHSASGHSQTHPLPPKSPQKQRPQPGATAASTAAPAPRSPLRAPPAPGPPPGPGRGRSRLGANPAETEGARPGPAVSGGRRERGWGRFEPLAAGLAPLRGTGSRRPPARPFPCGATPGACCPTGQGPGAAG